ncbi:MAG: ATP-binding protein [Syntrophobacteraceae bacterium]|nr:ATP-binding protein [Syntrophobacteraceae bacterium]
MKNISNSLAFRLLCTLLFVSALVFVSLTLFIIRAEKEHITGEAVRTNKLLLRSMRQSMLLNRQQDVSHTVDTLGSGPGFYGLRIYDKDGKIVFSAKRREIGRKANKKAKECIVCHSGTRPREDIPEAERTRIFVSPDGYRILGAFEPIHNEAACSAPGCHPPPSRQKILGMLDSQFNVGTSNNIFNSLNLMILYSLGAILLIELFAGLFIIRNVHMRLVKLVEGPREVKKGNLDFRIAVEGNDEIADVARSFNSMVASLERAEAENRELSRRVVHSEKMASMGKLAASVAHEINNPLSGVLAYARLISRKMSEGPMTEAESKEALKQFDACIGEIKRCGNIVRKLLRFSRNSESVVEKVDIHNIIEKSLLITSHHFQIHSIRTIIELEAKDPAFFGDPNQIEQVLVALFMNAVEAMPPGGALTVATSDAEERNALRVRVADNGRGIPPEIRANIFEPFFTTKEGEHSAGLGLSVVYGIMLKHHGQIEVESEPGRGTAFILTFPREITPNDESRPLSGGAILPDP